MASVPVRQPCRCFVCRKPRNVLIVICMLVVIIWSHVVFYQSTIVHLPPTTTALPYYNVSRNQTSTARTTSGQRTPTEHPSALTTPKSSSYSSMVDQRRSKTAAEHVHSDGNIIILRHSVMRTEARRPELEMVSKGDTWNHVDDVTHPTERGVPQRSQTRIQDGVRDRNSSVDSKRKRSHLITSADEQSWISTPPVSTSVTSESSSHRFTLLVSVSFNGTFNTGHT